MLRKLRKFLNGERNQKCIFKKEGTENLFFFWLQIKFHNAGRKMKTLERQSWSRWLTAAGSWREEKEWGDH